MEVVADALLSSPAIEDDSHSRWVKETDERTPRGSGDSSAERLTAGSEERRYRDAIAVARHNFSYTACYCEENVYRLCQSLVRQGIALPDASDLLVIFISNEGRHVPLWRQQASTDQHDRWQAVSCPQCRPLLHLPPHNPPASPRPAARQPSATPSSIPPSHGRLGVAAGGHSKWAADRVSFSTGAAPAGSAAGSLALHGAAQQAVEAGNNTPPSRSPLAETAGENRRGSQSHLGGGGSTGPPCQGGAAGQGAQRRAAEDDGRGLVVWDYHVIAVQGPFQRSLHGERVAGGGSGSCPDKANGSGLPADAGAASKGAGGGAGGGREGSRRGSDSSAGTLGEKTAGSRSSTGTRDSSGSSCRGSSSSSGGGSGSRASQSSSDLPASPSSPGLPTLPASSTASLPPLPCPSLCAAPLAQVWDLDATLPLPCRLCCYVRHALWAGREGAPPLLPAYSRLFRIISAPNFLRLFASDRSHMRRPSPSSPPSSSDWLAAPPPEPPIVASDGSTCRLQQYVAMRGSEAVRETQEMGLGAVEGEDFGVVVDEEGLLRMFGVAGMEGRGGTGGGGAGPARGLGLAPCT